MDTYYLDKFNKTLCVECAETVYDIIQCTNGTGVVKVCSCCGEDIPYTGQVYAARPSMSVADWDAVLR